MTEKEKMINGLAYDAGNEELVQGRKNAKIICYEYNGSHPNDEEKRTELLKKLLGGTGRFAYAEPPIHFDYGYNTSVGEGFYSNYNLTVLDCARVTMGNHIFIGPNVGIYTAIHPVNPVKRNAYIESAAPITIGNNVWIGGGTTILPGVTIGDNTVIGGGSVVVKDIPPNVVAVGNPCRPIKKISVDESALEEVCKNPELYRQKFLEEDGVDK